jgi:SAM-dependent methyltransferase
VLQRWLPHLPRGRALDVATGLGRNALALARAGYRVDAIDISREALRVARDRARRLGVRVRWIEADLDTVRLPAGRYAVVVYAFFLKRRLWRSLLAAVRPGGVVIIETHLQDPTGREAGPPARYRLRPGELARRLRGWEILDYEEGRFQDGRRAWHLGRAVARRPVSASRWRR